MDWTKTRLSRAALCALVLVAGLRAAPAWAQAAPAAFGGSASLWVGAEYSYVNPSFPYQSNQRLQGAGAFVDYNFHGHFGMEGNAQFLRFGGFHEETESSYLVGPKFRFRYFGKLQPFAQGLVGISSIHYPFSIGDASYFDIAPGGGVNYRLGNRWLVRARYEYQLWLNSPGYSNEPDHPIRPNGLHLGLAYRLFH